MSKGNGRKFYQVLNYFSKRENILDWGDQLYSNSCGLPIFEIVEGNDSQGTAYIKVEYFSDLDKSQQLDQDYFGEDFETEKICLAIEEKVMSKKWWLQAENYAGDKIFGLQTPIGNLKLNHFQTGIRHPFSCAVRESYDGTHLNKLSCQFEIALDTKLLKIGDWYEIYFEEYQRTMCDWGETEKVHYFLWHSNKWLQGMSTIKPEYVPSLQEWLQIEKSPKRDGFRIRILTEIHKENHIWLRFSWLLLDGVPRQAATTFLYNQLK
ncbi:TPA: hypothetical protein ACGOTT_002121 [Streptococcus suis]